MSKYIQQEKLIEIDILRSIIMTHKCSTFIWNQFSCKRDIFDSFVLHKRKRKMENESVGRVKETT